MDCRKAGPVDAGYRGGVHGIELTDLLQMLHLARASVRVRVEPERMEPEAHSEPGAIVLREGEIVHAEAGALEGREAMRALLEASSGQFQTEDPPPSLRTTVDVPFQLLLLDLARESDEAAAGRQPSWSAGLELVTAGAGLFDESSPVERQGESGTGVAEPPLRHRSRLRWGCRAAAIWGAATGVLLAVLIVGVGWTGGKSAPAETPAGGSRAASASSGKSVLAREEPARQQTPPDEPTLARKGNSSDAPAVREPEIVRVSVAARRPSARSRWRRAPRAPPKAPPSPKPAHQRPKTDLIDPWSR